MRTYRSMAWAVLLAGGGVALCFFVLSFLAEPSATGRTRAALYVIGIGLAFIGVGGGAAVLWMLLRRRT